MTNFAPLLGLLGVVSTGKRRRKKKSSTNGASTQRKSSRALDIIRIQRGLSRNNTSSETADEVAETPTNGQVRPNDVPTLRISKMIGSDTIGLTSDGNRGYVGAQWWARYGRDMLNQIRRRYPDATPEEALSLLLKNAVPSVDWENEEMPRGAQMLSRRLRRLVEAAYMGREPEAPVVPVYPQEARPGKGREPRVVRHRPQVQDAQETAQEVPHGMPFSEGAPPPETAMGAEAAPEAPLEAEAAQEAQSAAHKPTRRGGRGGSKSVKESAHVAPENGPESADGGSAGGDSAAIETDADPAAGQ